MSPSETSATMGVIASAPVVRGRDAELAAIRVQLDRVRSGAGAAVLVEGEPGMGKSRLLAESARIARRLGFRVGTGVAEPNTRAVELAPLMTALFDGPDPLLNREDLHDLRSVAEQRYWLLPVGHFPRMAAGSYSSSSTSSGTTIKDGSRRNGCRRTTGAGCVSWALKAGERADVT